MRSEGASQPRRVWAHGSLENFEIVGRQSCDFIFFFSGGGGGGPNNTNKELFVIITFDVASGAVSPF